jgi:flavin reductase (DIM6/NTAB) family NADH-FMN oxidoreductase RutF
LNLPGIELVDKVIPTAKKLAPEVDEFVVADLEEKPSVIVKAPGIAGCYAWMECELVHQFSEEKYVLLVGKVVRLEIADYALNPDASLNLSKARPLMMSGLGGGMHFCTVHEIDKFEPFGAMFQNGKDPFADRYKD